MPPTEFDLIRDYLTGLGHHRLDVLVGVGDDAACVEVPVGTSVTTIAASVRGAACGEPSGEDFGYLSFAHALMCVFATGARPVWATLALTMPALRAEWLGGFSAAVDALAKEHFVSLVGGDSTEGPLIASFFISALVDTPAPVSAHTPRPGDAVFVVGTVGRESAAALAAGPGLGARVRAATHIRGGLRDSVARLTRGAGLGACLWHDRLGAAVHTGTHRDLETLLGTPGFLALCCIVSAGQSARFGGLLEHGGVPSTHVGVVEARPGVRASRPS